MGVFESFYDFNGDGSLGDTVGAGAGSDIDDLFADCWDTSDDDFAY